MCKELPYIDGNTDSWDKYQLAANNEIENP